MSLKIFAPTVRGPRCDDEFGSGCFRAPRGHRLHKGLDFRAEPGDPISSPVAGRVGRIGTCYSDDPSFRLIEIDCDGAQVRIFYVTPTVGVGDELQPGDLIGHAQNLAARYGRGMTNHVHLEIRLTSALLGRGREPGERVWVNPELFMTPEPTD